MTSGLKPSLIQEMSRLLDMSLKMLPLLFQEFGAVFLKIIMNVIL